MGWYVAVYYLLALLGVNLGYHRMLAHRAVRLARWLEPVCVVLGLPAGRPAAWVANHRRHHAHADTALDPHRRAEGFWYAHCGWYYGWRAWPLSLAYALLGPQRLLVDACLGSLRQAGAPDIAAVPFYGWLSRRAVYGAALVAHYALAVGVPVYLWGLAGFVLAWLTWMTLYNLGDAINSVGHDERGPVDVAWLSWLTAGEGWHAGHHRWPAHPRHGRGAGEWDLTWQVIRLLSWAGLARREEPHASA